MHGCVPILHLRSEGDARGKEAARPADAVTLNRLLPYTPPMIERRPSGFIEPCLPSKVARPPSGPLWVHEIKHEGYRLMVRRDGSRVRCFTRNGHDWADRFPAIVDAASRIQASSFLIDGEAVIARDDGTPDFQANAGAARHRPGGGAMVGLMGPRRFEGTTGRAGRP